jgi:hypothetical protein
MMTSKEIETFKNEVRKEIREEVKANFAWMKWVLGLIILLLTGFEANNVLNSREISQIKTDYVTKDDNDRLKLEITQKFSLPVQLVMAKLDQVNAKMGKHDADYKKAIEDEKRIMNEMIKLDYQLNTRGGR